MLVSVIQVAVYVASLAYAGFAPHEFLAPSSQALLVFGEKVTIFALNVLATLPDAVSLPTLALLLSYLPPCEPPPPRFKLALLVANWHQPRKIRIFHLHFVRSLLFTLWVTFIK